MNDYILFKYVRKELQSPQSSVNCVARKKQLQKKYVC